VTQDSGGTLRAKGNSGRPCRVCRKAGDWIVNGTNSSVTGPSWSSELCNGGWSVATAVRAGTTRCGSGGARGGGQLNVFGMRETEPMPFGNSRESLWDCRFERPLADQIRRSKAERRPNL